VETREFRLGSPTKYSTPRDYLAAPLLSDAQQSAGRAPTSQAELRAVLPKIGRIQRQKNELPVRLSI